jgi:hypothetical protein
MVPLPEVIALAITAVISGLAKVIGDILMQHVETEPRKIRITSSSGESVIIHTKGQISEEDSNEEERKLEQLIVQGVSQSRDFCRK